MKKILKVSVWIFEIKKKAKGECEPALQEQTF